MNFGEMFSLQVQASDLSRRELAKAIGFKNHSQINYYMKSESLPKDDILTKICAYFGVARDYYTGTEEKQSLSRPKTSYKTALGGLPVFSDETADAVKTDEVVIPYLKITDGFVIIVDKRLEKLGFQLGSSIFLSRKFDKSSVNMAIIQKGSERFFAICERRGKNTYAYPLDKEKEPIKLGDKRATVYAAVECILSQPDLNSFRR